MKNVHLDFLRPLFCIEARDVFFCEYNLIIIMSNTSIMMCNLLLYTDIKSTKIYGNGKSGLEYYILVKKYSE